MKKSSKLKNMLLAYMGACFLVAGCATDLEKGKKYLAKGDYANAHKYYDRAVSFQTKQSQLPKWKDKRYKYKFDISHTAEAILGKAHTYKAEEKRNDALYYYFYYVQFCLRHDLNFDDKLKKIRDYMNQDKKGDEDARLDGFVSGE